METIHRGEIKGEVFIGESIPDPLPISPIDGYQYSREELTLADSGQVIGIRKASPAYKRERVRVGDREHETVEIGDCNLKLSIDESQIDNFIARLERAIAAFKAEWENK